MVAGRLESASSAFDMRKVTGFDSRRGLKKQRLPGRSESEAGDLKKPAA